MEERAIRKGTIKILAGGGFKPELVFSDLILSGMRTPHLVQELPSRGLDFKTIFISGYRASRTQTGASDNSIVHVRKPFPPSFLLEQLDKLMSTAPRPGD